MAGLSKLQQAMAYQALYGALGPVVKAGGDGLRGEVDDELRAIYEQTGAKTYKVQAEGVPMGTYSIVETSAVPEHTRSVLDLVDEDVFDQWLADNVGAMVSYVWADPEKFVEYVASTTGELPDGVESREVTVPATPARYRGSQMRIDKAFQSEVKRRMAEGLQALVLPAGQLIGDGS